MIVRLSGARAHRDAPALRFLLLCLAGWIVLRLALSWAPGGPPPAPWGAPGAADPARAADRLWAEGATVPPAAAPHRRTRVGAVRSETDGTSASLPGAASPGVDRAFLRLALMTHALAPRRKPASFGALSDAGPDWLTRDNLWHAEPAAGAPGWIRRDSQGWSASAWLYLRPQWASAPDDVAAAGQIGGSQAGLRVAHALGRTGIARAYGRATVALDRPSERELAFGLALSPAAGWPVDIAVEQRVAAGSEGHTALAVMAVGGVGDVALPAGFRLEAYAQAGIVGAERRDGFVDGAVAVDRRIASFEASSLSLGALAAGAAQPDAARLDIGPRMTLRLPKVGQGSRIAVDWRQRIAGEARPASGIAVTLASDF